MHRDLLERIANTDGVGDERKRLFEEFRVEVSGHAAAEEESLYSTMLGKPDLRDDARHSVSEHKEIDDFLTELYEMDMADDAWLTKFGEMRHRYEHHIDEEEEEMFPAAADSLSDEEQARLASVFERRKPREVEMAAATEPGADDRD
jgi:hemerythrin-like domain-containing protein